MKKAIYPHTQNNPSVNLWMKNFHGDCEAKNKYCLNSKPKFRLRGYARNGVGVYLFLLFVLLILFIFALGEKNSGRGENYVQIKEKKFAVELALTGEEKIRGLGGREEICISCGMLFVLGQSGKYSFWMKDMKFPLDIIWISDGKISHIAKNIPPDYQGVIFPDASADNVLEINGGLSEKLNFKIGDSVLFSK